MSELQTRILLVDFETDSRWESRLTELASDVAVVQYKLQQCADLVTLDATVFIRVSQFAPATVGQIRDICRGSLWVVLFVDRDDAETWDHVLAAGANDCLTPDCCDQQLLSRLNIARKLSQTHLRLAQAQKLQSVGELAAGIAHEINTPIQYVGDNTHFLEQAFQDMEAVLSATQEIANSSGDQASLVKLREAIEEADVGFLSEEVPVAIHQTLDGVARVTSIVRAMKEFAHPGQSSMTDTDLAKAIENTITVARNEWKYVAEVDTDFDPDLAPVPCLPGEINQVLLILIVNAAHAIGARDAMTDKGRICVSTRKSQHYAEIRVTDTGQGIPPENLALIFKPFFTTKPRGQGTGQGLAIAHSVIVEKHAGTIDVQSQLGHGTTFTVRLPLSVTQSQETENEFATDGAMAEHASTP